MTIRILSMCVCVWSLGVLDVVSAEPKTLPELVEDVDRARGPAAGRWSSDDPEAFRYIVPGLQLIDQVKKDYVALLKADAVAAETVWARLYQANLDIAEGRLDKALAALEAIVALELPMDDWSVAARLLAEVRAQKKMVRPLSELVEDMKKRGASAAELKKAVYAMEVLIRAANTPVITPLSGTYDTESVMLTIEAHRTLIVLYTLDGSAPTRFSYQYRYPVKIENTGKPVVVRARAYASDAVGVEAKAIFDMHLKD